MAVTILGIDTTGDELAVGLSIGQSVRTETLAAKPHAHHLLDLASSLLAERRPEAIVVSTGPGSYTGTRIGVTAANTLGWAWHIPVYGIEKSRRTMRQLLLEGRRRYERGDRSPLAKPLYQTVAR